MSVIMLDRIWGFLVLSSDFFPLEIFLPYEWITDNPYPLTVKTIPSSNSVQNTAKWKRRSKKTNTATKQR